MKDMFDYLDDSNDEQVEHKPDELQKETAENKQESTLQTVEINGHKLQYDPDTEEFIPPEGFEDMDEAEQQAIQLKANEYVATLAKAKKKNYDLNQREAELKKREQALAEREKNLKTGTSDKAKPENEPMKYWGVETWEDVDLLSKEAYQTGFDKKVAENVQKQVAVTVEATRITNEIISQGYDIDVIKQFASEKEIGSLQVAFDYYKLSHPANKAKFRRTDIGKPIDKGQGGKPKAKNPNAPMGWLDDLT